MTTKEAFEHLISQRAWYKELGIPEGTAANLKNSYKNGKVVSTDRIEEILEKAGYKVKQEKLWEQVGYSVDENK